jgi:hypothetical protein
VGVFTSVVIPKPILCANTGNCDSLPVLSIDNEAIGVFQNQQVVPPKIDLATETFVANVLGDYTTSQGEKHIYVDLEKQLLSAYDGDTLFFQTPISSGKWGRTPPGEYTIWVKLRSTRMSGGSGNDYTIYPTSLMSCFSPPESPKGAG